MHFISVKLKNLINKMISMNLRYMIHLFILVSLRRIRSC